MPESEMSKKLTKTIKMVDKLISDLQKDVRKAMEALRELKDLSTGRKKDE